MMKIIITCSLLQTHKKGFGSKQEFVHNLNILKDI